MASSQPNPMPDAFTGEGQREAYKYCSETLASFIVDEEAQNLVKCKLDKHLRNTKKRCEQRYFERIKNGDLKEPEFNTIVNGETEAINAILDRIGG